MAERDLAGKAPDYQGDIAHLLPAELTAFYISVKGIVPSADVQNTQLNLDYLYILVALGCVLALLFYFIMPQMLNIKGRSQRVLYCVTFIVWVLGIEIDRLLYLLQFQHNLSETVSQVIRVVVNLVVAIWSFGVPFLFRRINPGPQAGPIAAAPEAVSS